MSWAGRIQAPYFWFHGAESWFDLDNPRSIDIHFIEALLRTTQLTPEVSISSEVNSTADRREENEDAD